MNLQKIQQLYKKYQTPLHVQRHMRLVAEVAVYIAKNLKKNNIKINITFVRNLALLHDFLKMLVFQEHKKSNPKIWQELRKKHPKKHDTEVAAIILKNINEGALARSVRTQQFDAVISKSHPLESWEEKIVYYADKRVAHTKVVTIEKRLEEGEKRYGSRTPPAIRRKIFELEKAIYTAGNLSPEVLTDRKWKNVF